MRTDEEKTKHASYMREYYRERVKIDPAYAARTSASSLKSYHKNKTSESIRRLNLKRRFGITPEQYAAMFAEQCGLCAICNRAETSLNEIGQVHSLCVDHNHADKVVRQLLCRKCNTAIGMVEENVDTLRACINYLLKHKGLDD